MKKKSKKIYYDAYTIYDACFCESQKEAYENLNFEELIQHVKDYADAVWNIDLDQASATAIALGKILSDELCSSNDHWHYVEKPLSKLKFLGIDDGLSDLREMYANYR